MSKQKVLDANLRSIQQIIFTGKTSQAAVIYYIYEKSKEAILQFLKRNNKNVLATYKWLNTVK